MAKHEERLRAIIDSLNAGYFFINRDGIITDVNDSWVSMYRYDSPEEVIGRHFTTVQRVEDIRRAERYVKGIMMGNPAFTTGEFGRLCKDGSVGYHCFTAHPIRREGELVGIEGIIIDITERKKSEKRIQLSLNEKERLLTELADSEARFRALAEASQDGIIILKDGIILEVNSALCEMYGYAASELVDRRLMDRIVPEGLEDSVTRRLDSGKDEKYLSSGRRKDGTIFPVEVSVRHTLYKGQRVRVATIRDITDRKRFEEEFTNALAEKDLMLRELHHRVKNNLALVISLLRMQMREIADEDALQSMEEVLKKVDSIRMIHERLHSVKDLKTIEMRGYLMELAQTIIASFPAKRVYFDAKIDPIRFESATAIPIGLLVTELLTNALKYGISENESGEERGEIRLSLTRDDEGYLLRLCNSGTPIPEDVDISRPRTLGLTLVHGLAKQLGGWVTLDRTAETCFEIRFSEPDGAA